MTEIVGPEAGIDHTVEIDHIVEIDQETTTKITIGKKIIGRSKIGNIEVDISDYYGDTCDDGYIDNCRNTYKESYRDKYRDKYRDDSFDSDRIGSIEKHCLHNARKDSGFVSNNPRVEQLQKVLQQLSQDKVVAIWSISTSINFDDMFDSIHSPEGVDHLTTKRITYVKSQIVEDLADENSSSINWQNDVNYINCVIGELVDSVKDKKNTCLTQDSQEDLDFIDGIDVQVELIEGKVYIYSIEYPITYACEEVDFQNIYKFEMVKLQDVPIVVANEQEIEECIQEEVVSDMTLSEVYNIDTEYTQAYS